jgi:hypothetical protein
VPAVETIYSRSLSERLALWMLVGCSLAAQQANKVCARTVVERVPVKTPPRSWLARSTAHLLVGVRSPTTCTGCSSDSSNECRNERFQGDAAPRPPGVLLYYKRKASERDAKNSARHTSQASLHWSSPTSFSPSMMSALSRGVPTVRPIQPSPPRSANQRLIPSPTLARST